MMRKIILNTGFIVFLVFLGAGASQAQTFTASGIQGVDSASGQALRAALKPLADR